MMNAAIDTRAARADANLREFSSTWASACATGDVWTNGYIVAATSGTPTRAYNRMFVPRLPPNLPRALREARRFVGTRGVPARLWILESLGIDDSLFEQNGFDRDGGVPTLALQPVNVPPPSTEFDIRPVTDEASLAQLIDAVAASFEFSPDMLALVFTPRLLDNKSWHGYVGYLDGAPVATSTLFVHEGVAGIYYVGTLTEYRKHGLGEAMTRRCTTDGVRAGCDMASLQASPMGLPVYTRMGFKQIGYYRTYVPKEA